MKRRREEMKRIYEELVELAPPHEAIDAYVVESKCRYGELTSPKWSNNSLSIRLHDTYGIKYGGKIHIDVVSSGHHLMLNKKHAPLFLKFIKDWLKKHEYHTSRKMTKKQKYFSGEEYYVLE